MRAGSFKDARLNGVWANNLSESAGGQCPPSCDGQDGKRAHALGAVDQNPLDICRGGRTGVEGRIIAVSKLRSAISVMEIGDDVGGVEQNNQVLREISNGVDAEALIVEKDRAGLRDCESGARNREVDVRQILRRANPGNVEVTLDLRRR